MPLLGTRAAASARGFGLYGLRLVTVTFSAGTSSWTSPPGVTRIQTAVGKGADGTAGYWATNSIIGYAYPDPSVGSGGSILDWSTVYNDAVALTTAANAGGTGDRYINAVYYVWPFYISDDTAGSRTSFTINSMLIRGTAVTTSVGGAPTSGRVTAGSGNYWSVDADRYIDPTNGAATTGFSLTFPGGTAAPATLTTFNNVSVTPGTTYTIVNNGSLTISYYA